MAEHYLFLVMFAILFATSNKTLITLYLWPFDSALTAPAWLLILSSFVIGGLLSAILLWGQWLAIRAKLWRLEGRFNKLQAETDKITAESTARQDDGYKHSHDQQGEPGRTKPIDRRSPPSLSNHRIPVSIPNIRAIKQKDHPWRPRLKSAAYQRQMIISSAAMLVRAGQAWSITPDHHAILIWLA